MYGGKTVENGNSDAEGRLVLADATADLVLDAAEAAGEDIWQLPIPEEVRDKLDSKVADLRSTAGDRWAGALVAAAFLREFVAEGIPWAHLDIAGPAFLDGKPYGYVVQGGTGAGVRTLIALARSLAA